MRENAVSGPLPAVPDAARSSPRSAATLGEVARRAGGGGQLSVVSHRPSAAGYFAFSRMNPGPGVRLDAPKRGSVRYGNPHHPDLSFSCVKTANPSHRLAMFQAGSRWRVLGVVLILALVSLTSCRDTGDVPATSDPGPIGYASPAVAALVHVCEVRSCAGATLVLPPAQLAIRGEVSEVIDGLIVDVDPTPGSPTLSLIGVQHVASDGAIVAVTFESSVGEAVDYWAGEIAVVRTANRWTVTDPGRFNVTVTSAVS